MENTTAKGNTLWNIILKMLVAKLSEPVNGQDKRRTNAPPLTVPPAFADRQSRRESPKIASRSFQFWEKNPSVFSWVCPQVRGKMSRSRAWDERREISYCALSADETSPALATPRHAITALLSCCFKCPCPPRRQPHFRDQISLYDPRDPFTRVTSNPTRGWQANIKTHLCVAVILGLCPK